MPLYKRRCVECNETQDDLYEQITAEMTITCPKCNSVSFTKVHTVPKIPPDGLYSFHSALDFARDKASQGHGNESYRL
jgi:predicted nucleic acid-binding Zn ribbon protein